MDFCVIMTVWNFREHLELVISRALSLFDHIIVLDNGSTDGSTELLGNMARENRIELYTEPGKRDRTTGKDSNFLLRKAGVHRPRWIVKLDHDEYYEDRLFDDLVRIRGLGPEYGWVESPRLTLWRGFDLYRVDSRYRWFREHTMFRWREGLAYPEDAVHHMERIPGPLRAMKRYKTRARLIHLSQVDKERVKKQIERLKTFDRDWTSTLDPEKPKVRPYRERMRRGT